MQSMNGHCMDAGAGLGSIIGSDLHEYHLRESGRPLYLPSELCPGAPEQSHQPESQQQQAHSIASINRQPEESGEIGHQQQ